MEPSGTFLAFAKYLGVNTHSFESCFEETQQLKIAIQGLYEVPPFSPDVDMVVFGSIARKECVRGSDVDWTLLVDGQADPGHLLMASDIRKKLNDAKFKGPGSSEMFGQISFSHDLIHNIGGQSDTNHNLSKRILLLLESLSIQFQASRSTGGTAYDRILHGIVSQYVNHDSGLNSDRQAIPRFLLNETMCVDFAYKQKEQGGEKWALRNIKLRISRKMLYVKGLLMCLSHYGTRQDKAELIADLVRMVKLTPMELLIELKNKLEMDERGIGLVIGSYDEFLTKLSDGETRKELSEMNMMDVYHEQSFINLRTSADKLQQGLDSLFINNNGQLAALTLKYCIF